jgi:phosphatidylserine/phosphatidylglycerophosphate/cardiolipin synthase-like enzyme
VVAQMFGTGPTTPGNAMSDSFVSALYAAEHELIITTPYFVPGYLSQSTAVEAETVKARPFRPR